MNNFFLNLKIIYLMSLMWTCLGRCIGLIFASSSKHNCLDSFASSVAFFFFLLKPFSHFDSLSVIEYYSLNIIYLEFFKTNREREDSLNQLFCFFSRFAFCFFFFLFLTSFFFSFSSILFLATFSFFDC